MKAKQFLWDMQKTARILRNRKEYVQSIEDRALQITSKITGDVSSGGISDKVGNVAVEVADLVNAIKPYAVKFEEMNKTLESLKAYEYDILFQRYVMGINLYDYALKHNRTSRWSQKLHEQAIKELEKVLEDIKWTI